MQNRMDNSKFIVTVSTTQRKIDVHSLTEAQKDIFLKYLKYDIQLASGNVPDPLSALMVVELNRTNVTHSKEIWLRLLKSWTKYIKSNSFICYSPCDKTMKEMLDDEFIAIKPSTHQLSCILDHLNEQYSPTVWKRIRIALNFGTVKQSEVYWKKLFDAAKTRTVHKAQLLQSLQSNKIEITDDLQMTEIEHRIIEYEKSMEVEANENSGDDQCRVCLEYGNGFTQHIQRSQRSAINDRQTNGVLSNQ